MRRNLFFFFGTAHFPALGLALLLLFATCRIARSGESWHVTPGAGVLLFSGGDSAHNSVAGTLRLGYDLDAPVSFELGGLAADHDLYGTWADAILHLARWERLDPFLSAGAGALWSTDRNLPDDRRAGATPRLGAGFLYTLSEHWSARVDVTAMTLRTKDRQAGFGIVEAGLSYYFGDTTPDRPEPAN